MTLIRKFICIKCVQTLKNRISLLIVKVQEPPKSAVTERFKDSEKLNFLMLVCFLGLMIFTTVTFASKIYAQFKSGKNRLKNNHLALYKSKFVTHCINGSFFTHSNLKNF